MSVVRMRRTGDGPGRRIRTEADGPAEIVAFPRRAAEPRARSLHEVVGRPRSGERPRDEAERRAEEFADALERFLLRPTRH